AAAGSEAEVQSRARIGRNRPVGRVDPQRRRIGAVAERSGRVAQAPVAERLQGGVVEALARRDILGADRNVVDHGLLSGHELNGLSSGSKVMRRALSRLGKI